MFFASSLSQRDLLATKRRSSDRGLLERLADWRADERAKQEQCVLQ